MEYRTLGRTGLKVSAIGLGTMVHAGHFGPMKDEESLDAIDAALDLGVNFIDTSDAYGAGYSETLLGKALKGKRGKVVLATKGGNVMAGPNRGKRIFAVDYIGRVMEESLRRLQTDYIDLYQLHNPDVEVIRNGEVWELLERRKKEGKIRHYGVSINKMDEGVAAVRDGRSDTIQIEYNLLDQEPAREVFPMAQEANVGVIVRVPLRRGLLTGKFTLEDQQRFQGEDVRARNFAGEIFSKELAKVERLRFLAKPGRSLAQAAIAFCIAQPAVSVVIPGARDGQQMRDNAGAAGVRLPAEDLRRVEELWRNGFRP
ncbi:MAG: aldo/keto reductase [Deltaproteobacteria bacterium]|nr:aldo/keto reductase [Deltaproteobacteria bacterium]MBI2209647.1 aldo/keto reductase [Deltaproteobacteria bacterium]MBI2539788.1 aldo/keto reductase [Deltaproteobacteria bacterium]MBI2992107.1 aldo/keto reductase [Deltaproteobacteria bacterium]